MNCGERTIKYLLFIFNLLFVLCGLALIIPGALVYGNIKELSQEVQENVMLPSIALIIIGCIIFVIAFFGCCGAIKESHCMVVTFAVFLLVILVVQVGISIYAFVKLKGLDEVEFKETYRKSFGQYWTNEEDRTFIDFVQSTLNCCGADGPEDYLADSGYPNMNGTTPWSCCSADSRVGKYNCHLKVYEHGCNDNIINFFKFSGKLLGGIALGIAAVELVGIVFALCLANSIRNADRRAYRV